MIPRIFEQGAAGNENVANSEIWLQEVSFVKGERYLIEAASGTGKTSLCAYIMGMRKDYSGALRFDGKNTADFSRGKWAEIRQHSLSWLPQEMGLFPSLTLMENILLKNRLTNYLSLKKITELIERMGLEEKINTKASLLSIGQQQRTAFIRALCQPFDFIILDEPVSHLDKANNANLSKILDEVLKSTGAGVILTSVGNRLQLEYLKKISL